MRFAWVGPVAGSEPLLSASTGTAWTPNAPSPDGWTARASAAEAVAGADFAFVASATPGGRAAALSRGLLHSLPPGACVVLVGPGEPAEARRLQRLLDDAGFDCLDLALARDPLRFAVGGDRDTFNLLRPVLTPLGRAFFCGAVGAGSAAVSLEARLLAMDPDERPNALPDALREGEAAGAIPPALRNLWKASALAAPDFDSVADRLTTRR